jgi:hypothetical protein
VTAWGVLDHCPGMIRRLVGSVLLCALLACTSPTLPLPPPARPTITAGPTAGVVHLSSPHGAEPNAIIVVINQNLQLSKDERADATIADANGTWEIDVKASKGDVLDITQEFGTDRSAPTRIQVP